MRKNGNVYYVKDKSGRNYLLAQDCGKWNQIEITPELENEVILIDTKGENFLEVKS